MLTLPQHMSSHPVFSWVRVTRTLVLCVCFLDRCLSFCTISFGHCVVCSSSIYEFWLPLWYLQALLIGQRQVTNWRECYTSGAGTAYHSGAPGFTHGFSGVPGTRSLVLCVFLQIVVCPFAFFRLAIVLSVLLFTNSDYSFGIFKLFLQSHDWPNN